MRERKICYLGSLAGVIWSVLHASSDAKVGMLRLGYENRFALLAAPLSMTWNFVKTSRPTEPCDGAENEPVGRRWAPAETL